MPRISEFYGIIIWMYHNDHEPPHFHAEYGEHMMRFTIDSLEPMGGSLPQRAMRLVREWAELHRGELMENWRKARSDLPLDRIEPLP